MLATTSPAMVASSARKENIPMETKRNATPVILGALQTQEVSAKSVLAASTRVFLLASHAKNVLLDSSPTKARHHALAIRTQSKWRPDSPNAIPRHLRNPSPKNLRSILFLKNVPADIMPTEETTLVFPPFTNPSNIKFSWVFL